MSNRTIFTTAKTNHSEKVAVWGSYQARHDDRPLEKSTLRPRFSLYPVPSKASTPWKCKTTTLRWKMCRNIWNASHPTFVIKYSNLISIISRVRSFQAPRRWTIRRKITKRELACWVRIRVLPKNSNGCTVANLQATAHPKNTFKKTPPKLFI